MKIVYRAGDITEAQIVRGMLESNDIEAHVSGFYLQGGIGEMAPTDLAKVHVPDEDYERARQLLHEYEDSRLEPAEDGTDLVEAQSSLAQKILITIAIIVAVSILSLWIGL